jgi:hypothetical protein
MKTKKQKHPISFYINGLVVCASLVAAASCVPGTQKATTSISVSTQINKADVTSVSVVNDQLIINGVNLNVVKNIKVENNGSSFSFNVISSTSSQIIAQSISAATLAMNVVSKLILSDAYGASTFQVTFSMTDSSVTTAKINDGAVTLAKLDKTTVQKGQTLKYNGSAWTYADLSESQYFLGTVNMTTKLTSLGTTLTTTNASSTPGDYYIVSTGGSLGSTNYSPGDWIISDGYDWLRIPAAKTTVTTFEGRQGAVTLAPADYVHLLSTNKLTGSSLNNFADVDISTSAPANGYVLAYNNATSKWEPKDLTTQFQAKQATGDYITALTGDVTATGPTGGGSAAATVASVGGASAANIFSTVTAVLTTATDANTAGALVKRNGSDKSVQVGPLTAQGITSSAAVTVSSGNLAVSAGNVNVTGNITASGTISGTIAATNVTGNISGNAANVTGTVAVANGGTGQTTFNNNDLMYYSSGTGKITGLAAATGIEKILAFDPVTGLKWLSNSSASFLKSDSVSGTYFTALQTSDLPSGTITGASSTLSNATYSFIPQYSGNSYTIKDSPISVTAANSRVGIGTTSPAAQLDVTGSMRVSGSALEIYSNGASHFIGHERNLIGSGTINDLGIQANSSNEAITFKQGANTERMRIDATTGYVGIGSNAPTALLHVKTTTVGATVATFQSGTGSCSVIPTGTGLSCSSDLRLKEHVETIMNGLDRVLKLRGVTFQWKDRPTADNSHHMGFIAQEVEKVAPELVREDKKGFKQVNYANFVAVLTEAVKDLYKKWFDDSVLLHREIASVKAENEALKAKVQKAEKDQAEMKARLDRLEKALNKK